MHALGAISEARVNEILSKMETILLEPGGNPQCADVTFRQTQPPEEYAAGLPNSVVNGSMEELRNSGYSVNIVVQIQYCSGFVAAQGQSFSGCTRRGSRPITLKRTGASKEAYLWLHEIGHSQGLIDRPQTEEGWVMRGLLYESNNKVSSEECDAFLGEQNFPILEVANDGLAFEELLKSQWSHEFPYEQIQALNEDEVQRVRDAIVNKDYAAWPNAVLILGLRGNTSDLELFEFVINERSEDYDVIDAKVNVPIALGYMAVQNASTEILDLINRFENPRQNVELFGDLPSIRTRGGICEGDGAQCRRGVCAGARKREFPP